ncbi:hypothetical protein V8C86DRAFT_2582248 [Haematococcus lacustris]
MLCASCLGQLGLLGNAILQFMFVRVLGLLLKVEIAVPEGWWQRKYFTGLVGCVRVMSDEVLLGLPLVADRIVLSHPGFLQWMRAREPYLTIHAGLAAGKPLSGRQLRQHFPQLSGQHLTINSQPAGVTTSLEGLSQNLESYPDASTDVLERGDVLHMEGSSGCAEGGGQLPLPTAGMCVTSAPAPGQPVATGMLTTSADKLARQLHMRGLWGFFQVHTSLLRPHKASLIASLVMARDTQLRELLMGLLRRSLGRPELQRHQVRLEPAGVQPTEIAGIATASRSTNRRVAHLLRVFN